MGIINAPPGSAAIQKSNNEMKIEYIQPSIPSNTLAKIAQSFDYSKVLNNMNCLKNDVLIKTAPDIVSIIIRSPEMWVLEVKLLTGEILTDILTILKRNKKFKNIIYFDTKSFTKGKNVYLLHEVSYWVSTGYKSKKIGPGKTCKLKNT